MILKISFLTPDMTAKKWKDIVHNKYTFNFNIRDFVLGLSFSGSQNWVLGEV
jgi:hypothetical protein